MHKFSHRISVIYQKIEKNTTAHTQLINLYAKPCTFCSNKLAKSRSALGTIPAIHQRTVLYRGNAPHDVCFTESITGRISLQLSMAYWNATLSIIFVKSVFTSSFLAELFGNTKSHHRFYKRNQFLPSRVVPTLNFIVPTSLK